MKSFPEERSLGRIFGTTIEYREISIIWIWEILKIFRGKQLTIGNLRYKNWIDYWKFSKNLLHIWKISIISTWDIMKNFRRKQLTTIGLKKQLNIMEISIRDILKVFRGWLSAIFRNLKTVRTLGKNFCLFFGKKNSLFFLHIIILPR